MDENLKEERKILIEKKNIIQDELSGKKANVEEIEKKVRLLSKEAKGSYSEEKQTIENIYNYVSQYIEKYEESLNEPYFGRIDFREQKHFTENIYIGKKGISNRKDGEAYYSAPGGIIEGKLELKRKFLYKDGDIEKLFDEGINDIIINQEEGNNLVDEFLKINLEGNMGKKLKEVVATIQQEQNEIIRWPKNLPIIVQGSAGSGKTTIALHRLAYLIYRYRDTMSGSEILVLAPNK